MATSCALCGVAGPLRAPAPAAGRHAACGGAGGAHRGAAAPPFRLGAFCLLLCFPVSATARAVRRKPCLFFRVSRR
jgi:hypothetical protein